MRGEILIGGNAGQGINKLSEIISEVISQRGYFVFNQRDYQSLIRGGHNFNIISFSDKKISSHTSKVDILVALDNQTIETHKKELKKGGTVLSYALFEKENLKKDLNIALSGAIIKILGIEEKYLLEKIKEDFEDEKIIQDAKIGYCQKSLKVKYNLKKLNNKIKLMSGSEAVAVGALNSELNLYLSYPMTPATGVMNELAKEQVKNNLIVFQAENEIAVVNSALGASFAGANVMIGTSGGGFDLMSEGLSFQGISELPLTVYLASRPGPGTGVPTYTSQADLDIALRAGHGEFPRIVVAPGDSLECIEKTNEAIYLANKFNTLSIILSDKHLAEAVFSYVEEPNKSLRIQKNRKVPGKDFVKASSYEHDKFGNTIEEPELTKKNADERLRKYEEIKKECKKFDMIKIHGKKDSKNLVVGWGSTKGAILDAIADLDAKFLQVIYFKPMSDEIRKHLENAKRIILVESNVTGQLGRLIREKTGIKISDKILRYDARPFASDELKEEIARRLK